MTPFDPAILIGVIVRVVMAVGGGWLLTRGVQEGAVRDFVAAAVVILWPIINGYITRVRLKWSEPPTGEGK